MGMNAPDQFLPYKQRKLRLIEALNQQVELLLRLDMNTAAGNIRRLAESTAADNFKVMVVGEFNRGKSTFINALLGKKVLPAYAIPTTAIINEVRWGDSPSAKLYYLPASPDAPGRTEDIPVDKLEEYVVAGDSDGEQGKPYEKVELRWPLEICADGVELIDAPGLNADATHQRITQEYLPQADAIVFVIACDFPFSKSEQETVAFIRGTLHHEDMFFVCTRIDRVDDDQAIVKKRLVQLLSPLSRQGAGHVYFVNAYGALEGRVTQDTVKWQASGVPEVERDLKNFLATDRGRLKLVRPAAELRSSVVRAREAIREKQMLLQVDLDELQRRYDAQQEPLKLLTEQLHTINAKVQVFRSTLREDVSYRARAFFRDLSTKPAQWLQGWTPSNAIGIEVWSKEKREALVRETSSYLTEKADAAYEHWQQTTLSPLVQQSIQGDLIPELARRIQAFDAGLDEVKVNLTKANLNAPARVTEQEVPMWQRVVGGVGGLLLGDVFSAGLGAAFGIRPALTNAGILLGVSFASVLLTGGLSLVVILPAMLAATAFQLFTRGDAMTSKYVGDVAAAFSDYVTTKMDELAATIARSIDDQVALLQAKVTEVMDTELKSVREQVEGTLAEKLRGQQNAAQRQEEFRRIETALDAQDSLAAVVVEAYAAMPVASR